MSAKDIDNFKPTHSLVDRASLSREENIIWDQISCHGRVVMYDHKRNVSAQERFASMIFNDSPIDPIPVHSVVGGTPYDSLSKLYRRINTSLWEWCTSVELERELRDRL